MTPSTPSEDARQVSGLTPFINAWKVGAALIAFGVWQGSEFIFDADLPLTIVIGSFLGLVVVSAVISLIYNYIAWRRLRYGFDAESIYLHQGILFRSERHVRLDRIQSVDLNRPLLARIFGYVSVRVSSAGGLSDNLVIAFVKDAEGARLRNEILARAAGVSTDADAAPAQEAPEHKLMAITPGRLVGSLLRSVGFLIALALVGGAIAYVVITGDFAVIFGAAVPLFAQGTYWWGRINNSFDFSVATSPDGIRLRSGLLSTTARTVPPGRVQAVQFSQPLLWRRKNWWNITLTVAGEAMNPQAGGSTLYPVATQEEAAVLLSLILPDLGDEDPLSLIDTALRGKGPSRGFVTSPRPAFWVDPLAWRRNGYRSTETATFIRRGRLHRVASVVPNARIQSIGVEQGPLERALGLASVSLHTVPGPVGRKVPHLAGPDARDFLHLASQQARLARAAAGPERWMERPPNPPESQGYPCA